MINNSIKQVLSDEDLLKTLPLLNLLMEEEGETPVTEKEALNGFKRASEQGYRQYSLNNKNEGIVGVIGLRVFYDPLESNKGFEVNNLIIQPSLRGQGLGTKLFEYVLGIAKEENGSWVRLFVLDENKKALQFYNEHKFKKRASLMLQGKQ